MSASSPIRWRSHQVKNRSTACRWANAGVLVANGGGEGFREAASGVLAGVDDQRWNPTAEAAATVREGPTTVSCRVCSDMALV